MQAQERERAGDQPILDNGFRIAAAIVLVIAAFSVLIMGMFAANADTPNVIIVGLAIILSCMAGLVLMIAARLASLTFAYRNGRNQRRTALFVSLAIYCVGAPTIVVGTWQCVTLALQAPTYQEASIEVPHSIPEF